MTNLLASSPSLAMLSDCIARFYGGETKSLSQLDEKTWAVTHNGKRLSGVIVRKLKGRYRFEMTLD